MKLVVISPEQDDPREASVLGELFSAGLERYHVRKPHASATRLEAWLRALPVEWRPRLVLHQHHEFVDALGLGGRHSPEVGRVIPNPPPQRPRTPKNGRVTDNAPHPITSRSCHDLIALRAALGHYDSVFFSPVFPSISKPGYGPRGNVSFAELTSLLATRTDAERRTTVLALGGITAETAPRALALGFDGVAVLGAIWQAADPVRAFLQLRSALAATGTDGRPARPSSAPQISESIQTTREPRVSASPASARPHAA